jgi:hypothetical protein
MTAKAQPLPQDAAPHCPIAPAKVQGWFETGAADLDGRVKPANSVTFTEPSNCSFYEWSAQMFLWLTSPNAGGAGRTFISPSFFDVLPVDQSGKRAMVPHASPNVKLQVRNAQVGPNGLPIVFDKKGRMFEVQAPEFGPNGGRLVRLATGKAVELSAIQSTPTGDPRFYDLKGKLLTSKLPLLLNKATTTDTLPLPTARRFMAGNRAIFLDAAGNVIDVEQGQAGPNAGVLISQRGSLVYYGIHVNDVFAYFLSGQKSKGITPMPTQFPTTQVELDKVIAFAQKNGKTLSNPEALAIEVKTAWVEATGLDLSRYITMTATIPSYDTSDAAKQNWPLTGMKTALLALVGFHVVGSTKGHPEMIWATFEHVDNAPAEEYAYVNAAGQTKTVPRNTAGTWQFSAGNSVGPFNVQRATFDEPNITAVADQTIGPSDTLRWKAFGAAADKVPNPRSASVAASNTEIISANNAVAGQLASADVRRQYIMTGATWTIGGQEPARDGSNQVGTSQLANTTMETYQQTRNAQFAKQNNCFACHAKNTTDVSKIFGATQPLKLP